MRFDKRSLRRLAGFLVVLYLLPGCVLNFIHLKAESSTFVCETDENPHGYYTYGGRGAKNIDGERCTRRIFKSETWSSAVAHVLFGPMLLSKAVVGDRGKRHVKKDRNH